MSAYDPQDPTARVSDHSVRVPGTPEEVWAAIATGPGISTWFVPAEVEEREGGRIVTHHGPYGDSVGVVTTWEPPRRFAYAEPDWHPDHPDAPTWATELLVEAADGGTCVVRLVSGFLTGGDGWEEHLSGTDEGWIAALRNLRLVRTHFPGRAARHLMVMGPVDGGDPVATGRQLLEALGIDGAVEGDEVTVAGGLARGVVVAREEAGLTLRTEHPPAILEIAVFPHDGASAAVRGYLFDSADRVDSADVGEGADGGVVGDGGTDPLAERWREWLTTTLPGFRALS